MKDPVVHEIDYQVGQIWYVRERVGEFTYDYFPRKIIGIYPHILLTVDKNGFKQAFTKACAFIELYTASEIKKREEARENRRFEKPDED